MSYAWESELPALAALDDVAAAEAISAMTVTARELVPLWQIKVAGLQAGWWLAVKAAVATNAAAAVWFEYYDDPRFENIDMDLVTTQTVLGGLVASNLVTQAQADAVSAMADVTKPKYDHCWPGEVFTARATGGAS